MVVPRDRFRETLQRDLPEGYYLDNFLALTQFVQDAYGELLDPSERVWIEAILACSAPARRLYVRLLTRRGQIFRMSRLHYPEIEDIAKAAAELASAELISADPPASLAEVLPSFTKPELVTRLNLDAVSQLSRASLVLHVLERDRDEHSGSRIHRALCESEEWIVVKGHAHFAVFTLCFFGNLRQDISQFVLSDIGAIRYESYPLASDARAFTRRQQIEDHLRCIECDWLHEQADPRDAEAQRALAEALPPRPDDDPVLARRLDKVRNRIGRQLERLGQVGAALEVYAASQRPPARERQVRLLLTAGRLDDAELLCQIMLAAPLAESERVFVERAQVKLERARGRRLPGVKAFRPTTTRLVLQPTTERVESAAREYFGRKGECYFVENSLVPGMLGLFAWDIVFSSVPGAFFNPFQSSPSDFREPGFRAAREPRFTERLAELDSAGQLESRVRDIWRRKHGIANPLVHWNGLSTPLLDSALERIPASTWRVLFERVLMDTRENTTGFPDLVCFPEAGGYEFVEIKGPGDALQPNQRRWMHHFARHDIPYRLVNVSFAMTHVSS